LKLASANVLVLDASRRSRSTRRRRRRHADRVAHQADDGDRRARWRQSLDEPIAIGMDDFDFLKGSHSRLRMGAELTRREMLRLALMSSENRAASSWRALPGRHAAFVDAMNAKAHPRHARTPLYAIPPGSPRRTCRRERSGHARARAAEYPLIREFSTPQSHSVEVRPYGQLLGFNNTNALVKSADWDIHAQQDRVHPRGGQVPGDAGDDLEPAGGDRAASIRSAVHAASPTRCASSTGSRPASRCRSRTAVARQAAKRRREASEESHGQRPCVHARPSQRAFRGTSDSRSAARPPRPAAASGTAGGARHNVIAAHSGLPPVA
jgi:hypothetical protein